MEKETSRNNGSQWKIPAFIFIPAFLLWIGWVSVGLATVQTNCLTRVDAAEILEKLSDHDKEPTHLGMSIIMNGVKEDIHEIKADLRAIKAKLNAD